MIIEKLLDIGVQEITINTHYKSNLIENFILSSRYSKFVKLDHETTLRGTAGTLKKNINNLGTTSFFVIHADNFFDDDLKSMLLQHQNSNESILMTMGVFITNDPSSCGTVRLDSSNRVIRFDEKNPRSTSNIANSAIYLMKPQVMSVLAELLESENDISLNLIPRLLGNIQAFPLKGNFIDIGTPETLAKARNIAEFNSADKN
jgi:mannose-1-phosphate guanylyltransferase